MIKGVEGWFGKNFLQNNLSRKEQIKCILQFLTECLILAVKLKVLIPLDRQRYLLNQIHQLMALFKSLEGLHPSYEMSPWFPKKHSVDGFLSTKMKPNHN